MAQRDYLRECMGDLPQVPIDEFNRSFCVVCGNRECLRAGMGKLSFDRRARSWKQDLFDAVPRASESDSRFDAVRAKRFVVLQPGPAPVVGSWTPADPDPVVPADQGEQSRGPADEGVPAAQAGLKEEEPRFPEPTPPAMVRPAPVTNTPFTQGAYLPGAPQTPKGEKEVENGGTFTFGGDDE